MPGWTLIIEKTWNGLIAKKGKTKALNSCLPRRLINAFVVHCLEHYANMSVQYAAIFYDSKNGNFHMKKCDIFYFFDQNIDCGYTLEPPQ